LGLGEDIPTLKLGVEGTDIGKAFGGSCPVGDFSGFAVDAVFYKNDFSKLLRRGVWTASAKRRGGGVERGCRQNLH
jgi:hypothetical protein